MNKRLQGDVGTAAAIYYYTSQGYNVSVPITEATLYDLVVENGSIKRVQCKTSKHKSKYGSYEVELRTMGGNQSWSGDVKRLSAKNSDEVFILTGDQQMYVIPTTLLDNSSRISLGAKWSQYKVTPNKV